MAAIGSPTVPCYFDEKGVATPCASFNNRTLSVETAISIVIAPDGEGNDANVETQFNEIVGNVSLARRTPLHSINGAMKLAARFSIPDQHVIYIHCKDGTYNWNTDQIVEREEVQIRPFVLPTARPSDPKVRSVIFNFNKQKNGNGSTLYVRRGAICVLTCIQFMNNCGNSAGAVISIIHGNVTVYGCVLYGACDSIDGAQMIASIRSYLIGSNRSYDDKTSGGNVVVDTTTAIETYIYGQLQHGFESDRHGELSIVGWVRIDHSGSGFPIYLPMHGIFTCDASYPQRIDIKATKAYGLRSGYYGYATIGKTTVRCNLEQASFAYPSVNSYEKPANGYIAWANSNTYKQVTDPLS